MLVILYSYIFNELSHDHRENLFLLDRLSKTPVRRSFTLTYRKPWEIQSEFIGTRNDHIGQVKIWVKNIDTLPLEINMQVSSGSLEMDKRKLEPGQKNLLYEGDLYNFVGSFLKIHNSVRARTCFELIIDSENEIILVPPINFYVRFVGDTL